MTLPWFSGKTAAGAFSVAEWEEIQAGTSLIGNGHYILDFFKKDRSAASGVEGISPETEDSRFSTVASLGGRVFYSGLESEANSGVVLFSPVVEGFSGVANSDATKLSECYQVNDPTSENLSDLLDTDGGVIRILEAEGIQKLYAFNNSIFVFAKNGVWVIKGIDDVFKATGFAVNKISSVGTSNNQSFVSADGVPYWWSDYGIHRLGFDQTSFQSREENLSLDTIQTLFDNVDSGAKSSVIGTYDEVNKKIYWVYPDNDETVTHKNNNVLVFDLALQAFYPWAISDKSSSTPHLLGVTFYSGFSAKELGVDVEDENEVVVTDGLGSEVTVGRIGSYETGDPTIVALIYDTTVNKMTMGFFNDESFLDWGTEDYSSYAVGGFSFKGDIMTRKNAPFTDIVLRRTETGYVSDGAGGFTLARPSGILVETYWDTKTSSSSSQQGYRLKRVPVVNEADLDDFTPDTSLLFTRLKTRGRGRMLNLKFVSQTGKDFILLGYGELDAQNPRP